MADVIPLAEASTIVMGQSPPGDTYNNAGVGLPLLNGPTEFGKTHPKCTLFTTDSRRECEPGDLIFCVRGSTTGRMNWADRKYSLGRGVCAFRAPTASETRFIRYCIQDKLHALLQLAGGGTFPNLTKETIESFEIPWPNERVNIADTLWAYDELIENSLRRIKILESMARSLYREWFVHFRFPGHESVPRVQSPLGEIPEGWEVKAIVDAFETSGGGTPSRKEESFWAGGTIQWYTPSDLTGAGMMFMDDSSDHITDLGLAQSSARVFAARSVMMTSRATIGAIAINTQPACTNQGFINCIPNEHVPLYFLYHWLKENVPMFTRMASGATFKEINRGVFKTIEFLQPTKELTDKFEVIAAPVAEQILALQRQILSLRRTRDLLLPRLISGQIDLSGLEI